MSAILNPLETRITAQQAFSVDLLVEVIKKYEPSHISLPPHYIVELLHSPLSKTCDFSSVRVVSSNGSIVTTELREKECFPHIFLSIFYGMTESPCTLSFYGDSFDGLTVGKITTIIFLKIVDEEEKNVGFNKRGEIRIKVNLALPDITRTLKLQSSR